MTQDSTSFFLLDERIQRFIWADGWEGLRDAQEVAIPLILKADRDVIVAAATAAGKTEAAFFPALTHLLVRFPGKFSVQYVVCVGSFADLCLNRKTIVCITGAFLG